MSKLFDTTIDALSKSLDMHLLRHAVITDNIANAETPFFKARRVDFEAALDAAVKAEGTSIADRGIDSVKPLVYEDPDSEMGQDLNSVDMDREMARMTKNEVQYSAATQVVSKKFALLKYAVTEGGR